MAQLPALYDDESEIEPRRQAYAQELQTLVADADCHPGSLAAAIGESQPFYLPYQGRNDRELQALYGGLICREMAKRYPAASLPPPAANGERVRVGFVSGFFSQHSVWKMPLKGWIERLDRDRFRVFGYHTASIQDAETERAASLCERLSRVRCRSMLGATPLPPMRRMY